MCRALASVDKQDRRTDNHLGTVTSAPQEQQDDKENVKLSAAAADCTRWSPAAASAPAPADTDAAAAAVHSHNQQQEQEPEQLSTSSPAKARVTLRSLVRLGAERKARGLQEGRRRLSGAMEHVG